MGKSILLASYVPLGEGDSHGQINTRTDGGRLSSIYISENPIISAEENLGEWSKTEIAETTQPWSGLRRPSMSCERA